MSEEEKKEASCTVYTLNENPPVTQAEIEGFMKEYAIRKIREKKIREPLLDAFAEIETQELRVSDMVVTPRMFSVLRKHCRDCLDINTNKTLLNLGNFGWMWGANIWVDKSANGIELYSEGNSKFKEKYPKFFDAKG